MIVTPAPVFYPPSTDPCHLLSVPGVADPSRKAQKKLFKKKLLHTSVDDVLTKHTSDVTSASVKENFNETECGICMEVLCQPSSFSDEEEDFAVSRLNKCKHVFHRACLVAMYQSGSFDASLQCPSCKAIHGEKKGICPPGFMDYYLNPKHSVPGFDDADGTIVIVYHIKDGFQGPEHPNPEMPYFATGFPRQCYLPNNVKGRKILQLLIIAWERRLTFTIGVSATTGADNTVTWNEIHHKTEWGSNRTGHGYPDPNYLENVLNELAIQGVTEDYILPPSTPIETISINESDPAVRPKGKKSRS